MKNRLRVLRAERGWSQAELAARLGVSRQTVNAIENERYDPSLPLAFEISRVDRQQADEKARHGQVVELMDAAKQVGISRLAIATRQRKEEPSPLREQEDAEKEEAPAP